VTAAALPALAALQPDALYFSSQKRRRMRRVHGIPHCGIMPVIKDQITSLRRA
jgi:hypothetical protein